MFEFINQIWKTTIAFPHQSKLDVGGGNIEMKKWFTFESYWLHECLWLININSNEKEK